MSARNVTLNRIYQSSKAAIDLASIMVGIIVIGLIGSVIAATVFAVIPWAQDNAAKQQLTAVTTAQSVQAGWHGGVYSTSLEGLLDTDAADVSLRVNGSDCYTAFKQSASGNVFYNSSSKTAPTQVNIGAWPATAPADYPADCTWPESQYEALNTDLFEGNLFNNPTFKNNINGLHRNAPVNLSHSTTYSPSGDNTSLKATRGTTSAFRVAFLTDLKPSTQYTTKITIQANQADTFKLYLRPNAEAQTSQVLLDVVTLKAGETRTLTYTGTTAKTENPAMTAFVFIDEGGQQGDSYFIDNVIVKEKK